MEMYRVPPRFGKFESKAQGNSPFSAGWREKAPAGRKFNAILLSGSNGIKAEIGRMDLVTLT